MHKQIATAMFLLFLLFVSTIILANVIIAMSKAANTIDPKADL
jgi:hypothetical protein